MAEEPERQYVNFRFYKLQSEWRRLPESEKEKGRRELLEVCESFQKKGVIFVSYSLVGIRGDSEFMLWRIAEDLELFEKMSLAMLQTGLGKYITIPYSYLAMTKRSLYVDKHVHPGQEGRRGRIVPGESKYLFVYPFVKTRDWYRLPKEKRQEMMDEHIRVGHKYPTVKLNTTYSFGLDDQEFVVAFETDKPADFLDLVMELREGEASRYTLRDTPTFTCLKRPLQALLAEL
ncbi:MAG: chlorite dismutase family protein [Candidatus Omnitrophica bacterium]|nr:chlorite dismutase family protein [Candidatus Omnitrophota bacterium]